MAQFRGSGEHPDKAMLSVEIVKQSVHIFLYMCYLKVFSQCWTRRDFSLGKRN